MIPLRTVAAATGEALDDLGLVRVPGMWTSTLMLPGDRGDSIQIEFQHGPGSHGDQHEFYVNMSNCLLPLTAYRRGQTLDEARERPPEVSEGVFQTRLIWPRGFHGETWEVTPATEDRVLAELATELRRSLTEVWLPILPRPALRALVRDKERKGPGSIRADPLIVGLMCGIEDYRETDLSSLTAHLRAPADPYPSYPDLAAWIDRVFLGSSPAARPGRRPGQKADLGPLIRSPHWVNDHP